jgi:hypothetical protein
VFRLDEACYLLYNGLSGYRATAMCVPDVVPSLSTLVNQVIVERRLTVITCQVRHVRSNAVANVDSSTLSLLQK